MDTRELIKLQIKSLLIVQYISNYSKLEKLILNIFQQCIVQQDHKYKSKLYFMYGCQIGNSAYYDIEREQLAISNVKYNEDESFRNLTLNKIIKFDRKEQIINEFNFNIDSIQTKSLSFSFHDSVIKFINMRNKLAHELDSISFHETKDVVEKLSLHKIDQFDFQWLKGLDLSNMDDDSINIISNLKYIKILIDKLSTIH